MGNIESFCLFLFFIKSSERLEILISWLHLSSRNYFQFQKYPWLRAQVYLCYDYWSCVILINWLVRSFHVKLLGKASRGRSTHLSKCRLCRPFGGWNQDLDTSQFFRVFSDASKKWALSLEQLSFSLFLQYLRSEGVVIFSIPILLFIFRTILASSSWCYYHCVYRDTPTH